MTRFTEPSLLSRAPLIRGFGHLNRGNGHARTIGKGDRLVIPLDEALLDLLLRGRDHRMGEPPAQVHGHQGDDLHGLARAGGLFDQDVFGGPADIGHQSHLVRPQFLGGWFHAGQSPWWQLLAVNICTNYVANHGRVKTVWHGSAIPQVGGCCVPRGRFSGFARLPVEGGRREGCAGGA